MKRFLVLAVYFLFFSFLIFGGSNKKSQNSTDSRKIVTVGYVLSNDEEIADADFKKSGYSYEYIQKLMSYTGWKCEYVYGSWNEIYEKLKNGKIDMMPNMIRTEERGRLFEFTNFSMGQETFVLFTKLDKLGSSNSRDIAPLNNMKIGVVKDTIHEQLLRSWAELEELNFQCCYYNSSNECLESFKNGSIDAFVDLDIFSDPNIYPIAKLDTKDTYFAFSKNNKELCHELNEAMSSLLYLNPYYNSNLWTKYYSNIFAQKELLEEEKDWLTDNNKITVGVLEEDFPYCYKDKEGNPCGYVVDLLTFTKDNFDSSVLDFSYKFYSNYQDLMDALVEKQVQLAFPVYMSLEQAEIQEYILSDTVYSVPMSYVCNNASMDFDGTIAIAYSRPGTHYMKDFYPKLPLTLYDSRKNCLESVLNHENDAAILNSIQVENFIHKSRKYRTLKIINLPHNCDIGFAVTRDNLTLLSLINRGICSISSEEKAQSITHHTMQNATYTFKDFIADYIEVFVFIAILVLLLLLLLVISLDKLRAYLNYDSLTRLLNRRTLNTYLETAKRKADEKGEPFTLLMLDIDDFKHVNDVYGHICGDEVLKSVAHSIMHSVGSNDYIFRWGGEEILVLVNADKVIALKIADRIRRGIQNLVVEYKTNLIHVTVTIGVASYERGKTMKSLFEEADKNMYEGKNSGKNIVIG